MKKTGFILAVALLINLSLALTSAASPPPLTIVLDGTLQDYQVAPVVEKGTVLVPMRPLWEALAATVEWNGETRSVRAVKGETEVELTIGSFYARVNNELKRLTLAPLIMDGATMVPLRFVGETLGARVEWLAAERQVQIHTAQDLKTIHQQDDAEHADLLHCGEAVEMALKRSTALWNARQSVVQAEERRTQLAELRGGFIPLGPGSDEADAADRELLLRFVQADIAWQMAGRQVETLEQGLSFQVRVAFQEVLQLEKELKAAWLAVQYAENQLHHVQRRAALGLESIFTLQNAEKNAREEKLKQEQLEKRLAEAHHNLNTLLGLETGERPLLADDSCNQAVWPAEIQLQQHIFKIFNESPHIWLQEQNIKLAELELDLYTFNIGATPYRVKEIDVVKEENNLSILKEDTEDAVRSLYQQLEQLEIQHSLLETALSRAAEALRLMRVREAIGLSTGLDVQGAEVAVAQLETQLQGVLAQYEQLYMFFEKPWLKPGS